MIPRLLAQVESFGAAATKAAEELLSAKDVGAMWKWIAVLCALGMVSGWAMAWRIRESELKRVYRLLGDLQGGPAKSKGGPRKKEEAE